MISDMTATFVDPHRPTLAHRCRRGGGYIIRALPATTLDSQDEFTMGFVRQGPCAPNIEYFVHAEPLKVGWI